MVPEEIDLFRAIKRSAIVLLLMARLGRSAGEKEIAGLVEMNKETVRLHLRSLKGLGLVRRSSQHNGYSLTRSGIKLVQIDNAEKPRNDAENPRDGGSTSSAINSRKDKNRRADVEEDIQSAEKPRIDAEYPRFHKLVVVHRIWRKRNKLSGARAAEALSALEAANLAALRAEGLGSNHRVRRICRLPHVTPEYIAGQARRLRQERRFAATLLLHIVESGDPLPGEIDYDEEDRSRYYSGAYADIIEH